MAAPAAAVLRPAVHQVVPRLAVHQAALRPAALTARVAAALRPEVHQVPRPAAHQAALQPAAMAEAPLPAARRAAAILPDLPEATAGVAVLTVAVAVAHPADAASLRASLNS